LALTRSYHELPVPAFKYTLGRLFGFMTSPQDSYLSKISFFFSPHHDKWQATTMASLFRSSCLAGPAFERAGAQRLLQKTGHPRRLQALKRRWFHASPSWFRIHTLEFVSFGRLTDDNESNNAENKRRRATVRSVLPNGSKVVAGQVAVVLQVDGTALEIQSPVTGTVVDAHAAPQSLVQVGDPLLSIDSAESAADKRNSPMGDDSTESQITTLEADFLRHMEADGSVPEAFWAESVRHHDDILDLMQLAIVLQRFPALRSKNLVVLERILELQQLHGASKETVADSYTDLGTLLYRLNDVDASVAHLTKALDLLREHEKKQEQSSGSAAIGDKVASLHVRLAAVLQRKGDLQGAFQALNEALARQQRAGGGEGEGNATMAATLNNLGALKYMMGDWKSAVAYYEQSLDMHLQVHGKEHTDTAGSYHNLATALKHSGNLRRALEMERTALAIRSRVVGEDHPDTAASNYSLAHLLSELGELDGALEQYQQALSIQESVYGALHSITASTHNNMGAVLYQKGDFAKAVERYRMGLTILQGSLPADDPNPNASTFQQFLDVSMTLNNVGQALQQLGDWDGALSHHTQAKEIMTRLFGSSDHPHLATTTASIGNVYKRQGKLDEALAEYRKAHGMLRKQHDAASHSQASGTAQYQQHRPHPGAAGRVRRGLGGVPSRAEHLCVCPRSPSPPHGVVPLQRGAGAARAGLESRGVEGAGAGPRRVVRNAGDGPPAHGHGDRRAERVEGRQRT
jgi:tetratricopeptide (TPR) repeat protein